MVRPGRQERDRSLLPSELAQSQADSRHGVPPPWEELGDVPSVAEEDVGSQIYVDPDAAAHDEAQGDGEGGDDGGYEDDRDVGVGGEVDEVEDDKGSEDEQEDEAGCNDDEPQFDPSAMGLKEISNLASFTVSSYKPGCGVKELRDDDANQFWQSDGPQPHRLNIHFIKRVEIRALRLYLDYELDESYTPTKIQITAGFGPNQTIPFTTMDLSMPKGWIDVPIAGAGGGADGNSLCCWFVRVIVVENHQNGKDTHIRGVKVYALDDTADTAENNPVDDMVEAIDDYSERMAEMDVHDHDEDTLKKIEEDKQRRKAKAKKYTPGDGGLSIPDFMREPEIR
ncbi:anaphase-promoting complex, subunit 10-domain-containing protein [Durotheca rogersii]|uniref:anaphase-promoting complex, subunit 10-domain-containing protein n=1 Tax=Durotheca rogersii TaxID=419775 RepID=UPI0022200AE0|nr:anaphase-promoting complex, subunit 10-domain-containing protein [Durotheca rogersii]KAI5864062.1 anaphase-promoting complex, subunit 10-domain-containing protein [Durotheca rogersii]